MTNFESTCDYQDCIDTIVAMKDQEKSYACRDYLSQSGLSVDEMSRSRMVQWCYQTVDYFKLSRNSASVAMSCLDRFLCTPQGRPFLMDKALYQLACIASLQMAIKVHEPVELGLCLLVELCRGAYTEEQIVQTEEMILNAIAWKVNPPCPKAFVQRFIALMPRSVNAETRRDLLDLACYQTEMCLSDYGYGALAPPSSLAFASLVNAISFCPEINSSTKSQFFRTLGKATGCTRYMDSVNEIQEYMQTQMQVINRKVTLSPMDCTSSNSYDCQSTCNTSSSGCDKSIKTQNITRQTITPVTVV